MKKSHFKIGFLTVCLVSFNSVASAQSGVGSCDSKACKCSKKHCDDNGLLEVINNAASNFEAGIASMIKDRDKSRPRTHCDCVKCAANKNAMHHGEIVPSPPPVRPHSNHLHIVPPVAQPDAVHPPLPPHIEPNQIHDAAPNSSPAPHLVEPELVPVPDSRNDPFKDEPTSRNLRFVPARPASSLRSNRNERPELDPQASNLKPMRSILSSKVESRSISDSTHRLTASKSTRRVQPVEETASLEVQNVAFERVSQEVVSASLSAPVSGLRNLTAIPPATGELINPLRPQ